MRRLLYGFLVVGLATLLMGESTASAALANEESSIALARVPGLLAQGSDSVRGAPPRLLTSVHAGADGVQLRVAGARSVPGRRVAPGLHLYNDALAAADVAVQTLGSDTTRVLTVIRSPSAATEYRYELGVPLTVRARLRAKGSGAELVDLHGSVVAVIAPPWAVDRNGHPVRSWYEIDGSTLVQHVAHTGAVYPVVADPTVSFGWFAYVRFSKSEVQRYVNATGTAASAVVAAMCALIRIPWVSGACASLGGAYVSAIAQTFRDAKRYRQCVELRVLYTGWVSGWRRYSC